MSDVLCLYYSRSGNTQNAMEEIASALGAELMRLDDGRDRSGWRGWLRAGMDAMRRQTPALQPYETERPLEEYSLVLLGTPVWAGRCAAPIRGFLKEQGRRLKRVGYVLTRAGEGKCEEVYAQMDRYTAEKHDLCVSLRPDSVGYVFWRDQFVQETLRYLERG